MRQLYFMMFLCFVFMGCDKSKTNVEHGNITSTVNQKNIDKAKLIEEQKDYTCSDLNEYVNGRDNIFTYTKQIDNFNYFIKFNPIDYIILKEYGDSITKEDCDIRRNELSDFDYFTLIISIDQFNDEPLKYLLKGSDDYYNRLSYLMNKVGHDIKYFNGSDTVSCALFHFERTFGVTPYVAINLSFESSSYLKDRVILFEDNLFNNGRVIFTLPKELFVYQPKLILK